MLLHQTPLLSVSRYAHRLSARKLAEKEEIDVRLYSIIYNAIEEIRSAMEGMLMPEVREEIVATLEIREVFKVTKVGTVAGCYVKGGKDYKEYQGTYNP